MWGGLPLLSGQTWSLDHEGEGWARLARQPLGRGSSWGVHWCKGPEVDVVVAGIAFSPLYSVGGLRPQGGGGCRGASRSQGQGAVAYWLLGSVLPLGDVG